MIKANEKRDVKYVEYVRDMAKTRRYGKNKGETNQTHLRVLALVCSGIGKFRFSDVEVILIVLLRARIILWRIMKMTSRFVRAKQDHGEKSCHMRMRGNVMTMQCLSKSGQRLASG